MKRDTKKLGELFRLKHGFAFKGEFFSDAGPYIVLTPGNFYEKGGFRKKDTEKYYVGEFPRDYLLQKDDLIVVMTEQAAGLLGSCAIVPDDNLYLHNQRLGLVVDLRDEELHRRFLYYLFNTSSVRDQIAGTANGTKIRHTSPSRIADVKVDLPPLDVQRRIAGILSAYDDLIENNTRRIKLLEQAAHDLYREWFVEFRFPGHESVEMVDSGTEFGAIPRGWEVRSFSELALFLNGYAFKPKDWHEDGLPIVKIAELKNGVSSKTPRNPGDIVPDRLHISSGDVLFSWSADLDAYVWYHGRALLNQHLFRVVPNEPTARLLIYFSLKHQMERFRSLSLGTTMRHIKRSALDQVKTVTPPNDLVTRFEHEVDPLIGLVEKLTTKNAALRETRDLLLPRLVSGELDPWI